MSVRCKFKVDSIEHTTNGDTIKMSPVYGNSDPEHENTKFWKYTPSGEFVFRCINPAATEQLKLGAEYYIDISPAG